MQAGKKILICGAGIAGPACAYWLAQYGYSPVVIEKAQALRDGGQNVDIKGAGQQVIGKMGLAERIEAKNTRERGQKYLNAAGKTVAILPKGAFGTLTSDFEILRGDLAQIMFEATRSSCEYRFGISIANLDDRQDAVAVTFSDGSAEDFELVICAEGLGSSTRQKIVAEQTRFRYLGAYMSFFKIPRRPEDDDWAWTVNGIGGTFITLRPGAGAETTVLVTFLRKNPEMATDDAATRKSLLRAALKGRGVVADRISAELDQVRDFYFGPMSQVQASAWSKGRFALLGDAAHCPTPFTGEGTALALVGAYVLAGEIKRATSYRQAFEAYEALVRPYVEASQARLSPRFVRLLHVKSRLGVALAHQIARAMASSLVQKLLKPNEQKRRRAVAEDFSFPRY